MQTLHPTQINPTVIKNTLKACRVALSRGTVEHVLNKNGHAIAAVRPVKVGNKTMFKVVDSNGDNLASAISRAICSKMCHINLLSFLNRRIAFDFEIEDNRASIQ